MTTSKLAKKRTQKVGLPAGSLVYTGERKGGAIRFTAIDYDETTFQEKVLDSIEACFPYKDKTTVTWINLDGVHDPQALEKLGECFGLHRLVMEDILSIDQRPKLEDYGEYLYIVLRMISYSDKTKEIVSEQVSLIVGKNFLLTFQEGIEGDVFNLIRERLRTGKGRIRKMGADYLAYSLLDAIVDNYFVVLERLGEKIELLEGELVENPTQETLQRLYRLKRELILLHKSFWPLREVASSLGKRESELIRESTVLYLRDVYDHVIQVIDTLEIYREMLAGMLDIYLSGVSNRLNAVMKVLTVIATIFMPLTFIAGVYGMNFRYLPELEWRYGYPLVLLLMLGVGVSMYLYFKKKTWL
jgi:magnesium transporter